MTDLTGLWRGLLALADQADAARERARAERRARPEAIARRQEAARRGWETRRAKPDPDPVDGRHDGGPGPKCDEMTHDSIGDEVFCALAPDHSGDCDDLNGCQWDAS
ncbi:hypothetical protein [Embleya sp. NPDC005971]|uniref:hypothetical protein n=1 Tax=Embleya sp. NPDC005971 TaxID=3156724 RepID=UPI0033FB1597